MARVVSLRRLFLEALPQEDVMRLVFVEEPSTNLTYCRRYGRAPAGRRLDQAVPLQSGPDVTFIAALPRRPRGAAECGRGRQRGRVCGLPGPGTRPRPAAGRRGGARQFVGA